MLFAVAMIIERRLKAETKNYCEHLVRTSSSGVSSGIYFTFGTGHVSYLLAHFLLLRSGIALHRKNDNDTFDLMLILVVVWYNTTTMGTRTTTDYRIP